MIQAFSLSDCLTPMDGHILSCNTNVICVIDQILSRLQDESLCRSERCLAQQNWAITYFTSVLFGNYILPLTLLNQKLGRKIYYLLFVSILIQIGWIIEMIFILIANKHDFISKHTQAMSPVQFALYYLGAGLILFLVLFMIDYFSKTKLMIRK